MPRRRAKLAPFAGLLIVKRVEEMGWTVVAVADAAGRAPSARTRVGPPPPQAGPGQGEDCLTTPSIPESGSVRIWRRMTQRRT